MCRSSVESHKTKPAVSHGAIIEPRPGPLLGLMSGVNGLKTQNAHPASAVGMAECA
jgi:hypothetical protein